MVMWCYCRYNGGEGFVPGAMFKKFDKRQATVYVKKVTIPSTRNAMCVLVDIQHVVLITIPLVHSDPEKLQ